MSSASFSVLQGDPSTWGVPPVGKTFMGVNESGQFVLKQNNGTITPIVSGTPGGEAFTNTSGTTTIVANATNFSATVEVTGTARHVAIVLDTTSLIEWQQLDLRVDFPELDNLFIDVYNTIASGVPLSTFQAASGSGVSNAFWRFYVKDGLWSVIFNQAPAVP